MTGRGCWTALVAASWLLAGLPAEGKMIRIDPGGPWFAVLHGGGLQPGDEVVMAPGVYSDARRLEMNHRGTAQRPIVIRANGAILKRPDARQNSINMAGCQHLELRGLEITGGSTGIRIERKGEVQSGHLLFEGLHIHHTGGVAITANHPSSAYERLVFRRNHIHHTSGHGEAFYLGGNNASDGSTTGVVHHCVIEQNYIHHLDGPDISQGDGVELKDGSYANVVRDNVIHDTKYPGVIVYGTDGKEPNVIERNVIWNTGDNGIQAAADAVIRNNIIFATGGAGIYSRAHQSAVVGRLDILHNTVVTDGLALRIIGPERGDYSGPVRIVNNALYAGVAIQAARRGHLALDGNAGSGRLAGLEPRAGEWHGEGRLESDFLGAPPRLFPKQGSVLAGRAVESSVVDDFNALPRGDRRDVGAYRFDARGNPGWEIGPGFKQTERPSR